MGNMMTMSKQIDAPVETVFDLCSDLRNAAERIRGIVRLEVLTDGPIRVGTRFRETRIMMRKECTEEMEIVEFTPPRSYTVACESCGCAYRTQFRFVPDGRGTRVDFDWSWQPLTFFAKLMMPLGKLMMGTMKKCIDNDLEDMKKAAEQARV